jgi:protein ImuB
MLWLALHLSALPLEALLAALPADPGAPARCVVEQRRVLLACPRASAAGVQVGISAASAAALLPGLQMLPRDPARESALVERVA